MKAIGDKGGQGRFGRAGGRALRDPERIAAVRAALEAGTYRIDAPAIAARLIEMESLLLGLSPAEG